MSTVVVTGGAGFIGRALCPALRSAGHRVIVTTRDPGRSLLGDGIAVRASPELGPESDWKNAFAEADAVVHLAARAHIMVDRAADPAAEYQRINAEGTQRLAEAAARAGARRFVFLSTAKVNGEDSSAAPFRETDPPMPLDAYALSKLAAERALTAVRAETGLETVVLRPPLVYGRGVRGNFLALLRLCERALPLPLAGIANRRSLLYVGNLADAILRCLDEPGAAGEMFLLSDGEDVSTPELVRRVAGALERPCRLFRVPPTALRVAARMAGRGESAVRLLDTLTVDDRKIRRALAWTPPTPMAEGLRETAQWFASEARPEGVDE
ncbi:MAG: NAD-dependent epimerase/dehydratase family protein [Rhodospirillales bacterium]|nr:NAD-dependent epimerase/dehydratase family protein [Rhodospirillales bacterium]MDP6804479.1 NAD-dependent epimerase/dehydratase family protein [Rhodospirillales bacterium]